MATSTEFPKIEVMSPAAHTISEPPAVSRVVSTRLPTNEGSFRMLGYQSRFTREEFIVLTKGNLAATPVLVRIHSQCLTGDVFGSERCDCGEQLRQAMTLISREGRGVVIYQMREGRGIGILNKLKAYALQDEGVDTVQANERLGFPADLRDYTECGAILADLGIYHVRLLTNNPAKIEGLRGAGLRSVERVPLQVATASSAERYLQTKRDKMGHLLDL